ncbi:hypothetical protein DFH09DRAFT_1354578 [Mycena vulgaris]|nr:hypothetical protein DFH09DRAFT_1354578 [Mycena vulgaris]
MTAGQSAIKELKPVVTGLVSTDSIPVDRSVTGLPLRYASASVRALPAPPANATSLAPNLLSLSLIPLFLYSSGASSPPLPPSMLESLTLESIVHTLALSSLKPHATWNPSLFEVSGALEPFFPIADDLLVFITVFQVSQLWRNLALETPLLWSSFTGGASKADCYRVPLILARGGSISMLHITFLFYYAEEKWQADALAALVPYIARIETLDVEFGMGTDVKSLLDSNLKFPSLKRLRLQGADCTGPMSLSLSAPQLQSLDIERLDPTSWETLLVPSLEDIRLHEAGEAPIETLSEILRLCPRVSRLVLHSSQSWNPSDDSDFQAFARRPLAPALRELGLRLDEVDLERVVNIGFSDVVLDMLTGCIYNGHSESVVALLARMLLPGVGPLHVFECFYQEITVCDDAGHTRRFQRWNDDPSFEVQDAWKHLSEHYDLYRTVREIRIRTPYWKEYIESFAAYPPQAPDGITLVLLGIPESWEDSTQMPQIMRIAGLVKVEFRRASSYDELTLEAMMQTLARIETLSTHAVEVCIGNEEVKTLNSRGLPLPAFETALAEVSGNWVVCAHCV